MRMRGLAVLASLLAFVPACESATAVVCPSSPITVSVTSSTRPIFTWTPNCWVDELIVYESRAPSAGGDVPVWFIVARTGRVGTAAPVLYGHVPFGMRQTTDPVPLVVGHGYRVILMNSGQEIATRVFGP